MGENSKLLVEDHSRTIKIITYTLLAITTSFFIARQIMKAVVFRKLAVDDLFILTASISAIAAAVNTIVLASNGLGVIGTLAAQRVVLLMKGYYISQLLYICCTCFSKLSILVLLHTVATVRCTPRRGILGLGIFIIIWGTTSILAVAFQCGLPRPWDALTLRCFDTCLFWIIYSIIDVFTEVCIILLSSHLVAYLQVPSSRKLAVVACFAPRILVIGASLARLIWLYPGTPLGDSVSRLWIPAVLTQVNLCLSICTACIPYMVPFFKTFDNNFRRKYLSRTFGDRLGDRTKCMSTSLWFRRQRRPNSVRSWERTAVTSLQYDRVLQETPQIPTPETLSPLTTPQCNTPLSASDWDRPTPRDHQGLCIRIPERSTQSSRIDVSSPQTASSFALSPSCISPSRLLSSQSFVPTRKAPSPPLKSSSPYPRSTSSCYSSQPPSPPSPGPPRFSLFPQQATVHHGRSSRQGHESIPMTTIAPPNLSRSDRTLHRYPSVLSPYDVRHKRGKARQSPKLNTASPATLSPPTSRHRPGSVQDLTSPMGTALHAYFGEHEADAHPTSNSAAENDASLQLQPRHQTTVPTNCSADAQTVNTTIQRNTSHDVLQHDLGLPRDSMIMGHPSHLQFLTRVRDA